MNCTLLRSAFAVLLIVLLVASCNREDPTATAASTSDWPTELSPPIQGATFSMSRSHLPGGSDTRLPQHRYGYIFINGASGRPLREDEPILAVGDGTIIRIDHAYEQPDDTALAHWADQAEQSGFVQAFALDRLRGRQVWIRHADGHTSRYAHLSTVDPQLALGDQVEAGRHLGQMGRSGLAADAEGNQPAPRLLFELWSPDGEQFLGSGLSPFENHRRIATMFGRDALPRFARQAVERVASGEPVPQDYPPEDPPDFGFSVEPPTTVAAGNPFAIPVSWEEDHFSPGDFYPMIGGQPLGVLDAGDGAWILGAMPLGTEGTEPEFLVLAIDPFGATLAGGRKITAGPPAVVADPAEVDAETIDAYSQQNLQRERRRLVQAAMHSLRSHDPRWNEPFQAPVEGPITGPFGQKFVHGVTRPRFPRPGVRITPESPSEVVASNAGVVVLAASLPIRGNTVAISHGGGIVSVYSGLSRIRVELEDEVERGQVLGQAAEAVQWEVHAAGIPSNPLIWLDNLLP